MQDTSKEWYQGFVKASVDMGLDREQTKELHKVATLNAALTNDDFKEGFLEKKAWLGRLMLPMAGIAGTMGIGGYLADKTRMWRKNLGKDRRRREWNNLLNDAMDFDDTISSTRLVGQGMEDNLDRYRRDIEAMGKHKPFALHRNNSYYSHLDPVY